MKNLMTRLDAIAANFGAACVFTAIAACLNGAKAFTPTPADEKLFEQKAVNRDRHVALTIAEPTADIPAPFEICKIDEGYKPATQYRFCNSYGRIDVDDYSQSRACASLPKICVHARYNQFGFIWLKSEYDFVKSTAKKFHATTTGVQYSAEHDFDVKGACEMYCVKEDFDTLEDAFSFAQEIARRLFIFNGSFRLTPRVMPNPPAQDLGGCDTNTDFIILVNATVNNLVATRETSTLFEKLDDTLENSAGELDAVKKAHDYVISNAGAGDSVTYHVIHRNSRMSIQYKITGDNGDYLPYERVVITDGGAPQMQTSDKDYRKATEKSAEGRKSFLEMFSLARACFTKIEFTTSLITAA